MKKQTFIRRTRTIGVLLLLSLIMFVTAASATETTASSDYQKGYVLGFHKGYNVGYIDGYKVCLEHGRNGVLTKIPDPVVNKNWSPSFTNGYKVGFKKGFIAGYNNARFKCLQ